MKHRRGPGRGQPWTQARVDSIDWTLSNRELESRYGLRYGSEIRYYLVRRGFKIPPRPRGERPSGVDKATITRYRKAGLGKIADVEVAQRLGVTRQAVGLMRQRIRDSEGNRRSC